MFLNEIFNSKDLENLDKIELINIKIYKDKNFAEIFLRTDCKDIILTDEIKNLFYDLVDSLELKFELECHDAKEIIKKEFIEKLSSFFNINSHEIKVSFLKDENVEISIPDDIERFEEVKGFVLEFFLRNNYKPDIKVIHRAEKIQSFLERCSEEEEKLSKEFSASETKEEKKEKKNYSKYIEYKKKPKTNFKSVKMCELTLNTGTCAVEGRIFNLNYKELKNRDMEILEMYVTDFTESICIKIFLKGKLIDECKNSLEIGDGIYAVGEFNFDSFSKSNFFNAKYFKTYELKAAEDNSEEKRVELHLHTKMSTQDALSDVTEYIQRAKSLGHKAIAITDHNDVQSFPAAMKFNSDENFKIIYGCEFHLVDDLRPIIKNRKNIETCDSFVVFDLETTGLSNFRNKIIEFGAVKIKGGQIVEKFGTLVNPEELIPPEITNITNITNAMVEDAPKMETAIEDFRKFIKDSVLVAHNASFDIGFLKRTLKNYGYELENPYLDTLEISRILNPSARSHRLKDISKRFNVSLVNAHRAVDDAYATAEVFLAMQKDAFKNKKFKDTINEIESIKEKRQIYLGDTYHTIVLVKNLAGLKNLYKLVSDAHMKYFYYTPRIPKSVLLKNREGLLIGTACQEGELYQSILKNESEENFDDIVKDYDFVEIQPIANNYNLITEKFLDDEEDLKNINLKLLDIADRNNKPAVATGDVHYLDKYLKESRKILLYINKRIRDEHNVDNYFKTTDEMLEEFSYFKDRAKEVVITNSNKIADMIENIRPIPKGTFPPEIEGSNQELKDIAYKKVREIYGEKPDEIIEKRLKRELDSIIKNGYSVLYIIAQKLVKKSNDDGYQVGSRGSVGSSFVATMCGITEVNPLPPHYNCPKCHYTEFVDSVKTGFFSGADLPEKKCPVCGEEMKRYGDDIPFEVFLGFDGDKEPDIDLNFAGEYQSNAHKYTEELFGEGYVFRAGTIGTIAERTAYGYVKKYFEENSIYKSPYEIERLAKSLEGVKRTTGQHAGGVMIVPKSKEIFDFTPTQHPADDKNSGVITTHFDYSSISGTILKLDILGHDVPSIIKMIESLTGTNFMEVPLNDEKVLSIFSSSDALNLDRNIFDIDMGTLGVPEFGTNFVRKMLKQTKPSTFAELVRISGLSHGTNVWVENAEKLVLEGSATLTEVISTREDIMSNLLNAGAEKKFSFDVMEKVRKGRGLTKEQENYMKTLDLPKWYIDSCKKISYMFPKAHAVAYVTMSVRIAYYKIYYPLAFYAAYLTTKLDNFNLESAIQGPEAVKSELSRIKNNPDTATKKELSDMTVYESVLEMMARGFEFTNVDLYKSDATKFLVVDDKIMPPLRSIPSLGGIAAAEIVSERQKQKFISVEDFVKRGKIPKTVVEKMTEMGMFKKMSLENQLSLFDIGI